MQLVFALALGAAACVALQALSVEAGLERTQGRGGTFTAAFVSVVVSVVVFWALLLVRGAPSGVTLADLWPFVVAGVLNPVAFRLLYFEGIDRVGARIAATINAAYPAVATLLAVAALGEALTLATGLGVACIVAGGALLQLVRRSAKDADEGATGAGGLDLVARELAAIETADLRYPVSATIIVAVSYVLVKYGLDRLPAPLVATAAGQTTALVVFAGILAVSEGARRDLTVPPRASYLAFAVGGVAVALAWLAQFFALRLGAVVTVIPLVSAAPLLVVAVSYGLAREVPRSPRVLAAVVAVVAGVVLVQLG